MKLTIESLTLTPKRYQRVGRRPIGAWYVPRDGWRVYFDKPAQVRVKAYQIDEVVLMPAGGILTIRPTTKPGLVPYSMHAGDFSDFSSGGAGGIDPFGVHAPIETHDRLMQRHAVGSYDVSSGRPIPYPKGHNLSRSSDAWPKPYDGEHMVRAFRFAMHHTNDPFVRLDLAAMLEDVRGFWLPYGKQILSSPKGGHGYMGRSFAWAAVLGVTVGDRGFVAHMRELALHCIDQRTGSPQRLKKGEFYGSPDPWGGATAGGGSGVPVNMPVFQMLEQCHLVLAFQLMGLHGEARQLALTVVSSPGKKWHNANNGDPVGSHAADYEQNWIALGALARIDAPLAIACAKGWPIMLPGGSISGPYDALPKIHEALRVYDQIGRTRAFVDATS